MRLVCCMSTVSMTGNVKQKRMDSGISDVKDACKEPTATRNPTDRT